MKYCKLCGSTIYDKSCSNKRCKNHIPGTEPATFKQTEFIEDMLDKLGEEKDLRGMTMTQASKMIKVLEGRIEMGE